MSAAVLPTQTAWQNPFPETDPRSLLLQYQHQLWTDQARFKLGLFSRQTGKDFTESGELTEDSFKALFDGRNGTQWMIAAPSERQSLETLAKVKDWVRGFNAVIDDYQERREGGSESLLKSAEVTIRAEGSKASSKVRAVPGKPDTVRGTSANVLLTEFDFFEDADATWRAILPSITNPLRGGLKKVRIITTPNGIGSAAHKIWTKKDGKVAWSKHKVTIYDAVRMGLPVDIEELREAFDDPEGWAQEFECEFLDTASVLLPYEVLAAIENPLATISVQYEYWIAALQRGAMPIDLGIDFGRKKDLTCAWALENIGGFKMTRSVTTLEKTPTHIQIETLRSQMRAARRICVDYTGPGIGFGDLAVAEFGEWNPAQHKFGKVELVTFTNQVKCEMFPALRAEADKRMLGIPQDRTIREDLHSMCRVVTAAGNVTYRAPHTEDGHADRCTALALANRASSQQTGAQIGAWLVT
jgi:phage FluMu gp28-like protein